MAYGYNELALQFGGLADDPHVAGAHHSTMAMLAAIIVIGAWLGSSDAPGRRMTALIAGGSVVLFGIASLGNPDQQKVGRIMTFAAAEGTLLSGYCSAPSS